MTVGLIYLFVAVVGIVLAGIAYFMNRDSAGKIFVAFTLMEIVIMAIVGDVIPVQRRGAATGTIMTSLSLAAIAGVPAGVMLGAHFNWAAPFVLLVVLSVLIWFGGMQIVPSLAEHLSRRPPPLNQVLPDLGFTLEMWVVMHEDLKASRRMRLMFDHLVTGLTEYIRTSRI